MWEQEPAIIGVIDTSSAKTGRRWKQSSHFRQSFSE
jgi:hypothetical protein